MQHKRIGGGKRLQVKDVSGEAQVVHIVWNRKFTTIPNEKQPKFGVRPQHTTNTFFIDAFKFLKM